MYLGHHAEYTVDKAHPQPLPGSANAREQVDKLGLPEQHLRRAFSEK